MPSDKKRAYEAIRCQDPEYKRKARIRSFKYKTGITVTQDQIESLREAQNNRCAICGTDTPGGQGDFHLDHNHSTGKLRGLLCMHCNSGIGKLKDNPALLRRAADYIENY